MKQLTTFSFLLLAFLFFSQCKSTKRTVGTGGKPSPKQINFVNSNSLFALLDQAEEDNKIVFVDVYTTWCLPCKLMDQEVFTDPGIIDYLNTNFISYKVDAEKDNGPDIAAIYEVSAYPTLLFMDGQGRVLVKKTGAAMQTEFMELAKQAVAELGTNP